MNTVFKNVFALVFCLAFTLGLQNLAKTAEDYNPPPPRYGPPEMPHYYEGTPKPIYTPPRPQPNPAPKK